MRCCLSSNLPQWPGICVMVATGTHEILALYSQTWDVLIFLMRNSVWYISYSGMLLQATMDPFQRPPSDYLIETHPLFLGSSFLRRNSPGTSPTEIKHFHQPGRQDHILFNNNSIKDCTCYFELPPLLYCGCCHIQAWRCIVPYSFLSLYVVCVHVCIYIYLCRSIIS